MIVATHGILANATLSTLNNGLFAVYNAENNTNDSFGSNNGTAQGGLTYTTGKINQSFLGNGTNAYVSLPVDQYNFTSDFTISAWINANTTSGNQMIFSNLMYNGGSRKGYILSTIGDKIEAWLVNQPTYSQYIVSSTSITSATWYNVCLVRQTGNLFLYVNNTLWASDLTPITLGYVSTSPSIGAYTNGLPISRYFNGKIDAVTLWNRALTTTELTELYNAGNGKQYPF